MDNKGDQLRHLKTLNHREPFLSVVQISLFLIFKNSAWFDLFEGKKGTLIHNFRQDRYMLQKLIFEKLSPLNVPQMLTTIHYQSFYGIL